MSLGTPGASPLFPSGQARQGFQRDWGNYASAATLPNGAGNILNASQFKLEAGDRAYVTGVGPATCTTPGTAGGGDAVWTAGAGTGDVVGPAVSTDNAVVRWDGATGELLKDSTVTLGATTFTQTTADTGLGLTSNITVATTTGPALTLSNSGALIGSAGISQVGTRLAYTLNQTGTAAFTALQIATTETVAGAGAQYGINYLTGAGGATQKFFVDNTGSVFADLGFFMNTAKTIGFADVGSRVDFVFGPSVFAMNTTGITMLGAGIGVYQAGANTGLPLQGNIGAAATPSLVVSNALPFTGPAAALQVGTRLQYTVTQAGAVGTAFTALQFDTTETSPGTGLQLATDFRVGGVSQGHITSGALFRGANGANTAPTYSFVNFQTTGMYATSSTLLAFTLNSNLTYTMTSSAFNLTQDNLGILCNVANSRAYLGGAYTTSSGGPWYVLNGNAFTASTAVEQMAFRIYSGVNQTSTASFASFYINQSLSSDGVTGAPVFGSGGGLASDGGGFLADWNSGLVRKFSVRDNGGIGVSAITPGVFGAGTIQDYTGIGTYGAARLTSNAGATAIGGILAPLDARQLTIVHIAGSTLTINNQDAGSAAGNRIQTSTGANVVLDVNDTITLYYDLVSAVWRQTTAASTADVGGPASSTDNAVVRWDGATGKLIQNSVAILTDAGELALGAGALGAPALTMGTATVGFYGIGGSESAYVASGTAYVNFSSAGLRTTGGSAAGPSHSFIGGAGFTDKGWYGPVADEVDLALGGAIRWSFNGSAADANALFGRNALSNVAQFVVDAGMRIRGQITTGVTPAVTLDNGGVSFARVAAGTQFGTQILSTVNQPASAAGFTALDFNTTETAVGSGLQLATDFRVGGVSQGHITSGALFRGALGSGTTPTYSFIGRTNDGWYSSAATNVALTLGGAIQLAFVPSGLNVIDAWTIQASAPNARLLLSGQFTTAATGPVAVINGQQFSALTAVEQMGFRIYSGVNQTGGASFASIYINQSLSADGVTGTPVFGGGGLVGGFLADWQVGLVPKFQVTSAGAVLAIGTVSLPGHSSIADPDTGQYSIGANDLGFSTNGVLRLSMNTTAITPTLPIIPNANNTLDLGTAALSFRDIFIDGSVRGTWPFFVKAWSGSVANLGGTSVYLSDELVTVATSTPANYPVSRASTSANLRVYVSANAVNADTVVTVYEDGAATGITLTIGALATGAFSDLTNTNVWAAGGRLDLRVDVGGAGAGFGRDLIISATLEFYVP